MEPEVELSKPIYELMTSLARPPAAMYKCKTIYEAVRVSRELRWPLQIERQGAVSMWVTAALLSDERSRRHMTKLIASEVDGERWIIQIGSGVHAAIRELDRLHAMKRTSAKDRTRTFQQHRDAAIRSLENARCHLAAIECKPTLMKLITHPDYELLRKVVSDLATDQFCRHDIRMELARQELVDEGVPVKHQWAELINRGVYFSDDPIPDADFLLQQVIAIVTEKQAPSPDRHSVRGQFLRCLYDELEGSSIANVRTAFLCHVADVAFAEPVDKAQIRRLVRDIAEETAARDARLDALGMGKKWAESMLEKRREDISLQRKRSSRPSFAPLASSDTARQSRSGSGHCEKVQNESVSAKPSQASRRPSAVRKPAAVEGSVPTHREKPK